jgi:uncharacterized RDD family membrane protein YckC
MTTVSTNFPPDDNSGMPVPLGGDGVESGLGSSSSEGGESSGADGRGEDSWRGELADRLQRYRSRRKPRVPRYPSLLLPFDSPESRIRSAPAPASVSGSGGNLAAHGSVAEDWISRAEPRSSSASLQSPLQSSLSLRSLAQPEVRERGSDSDSEQVQVNEAQGKILEFPRSAAIPIFIASELADPVMDRPRIVEAPEVLPPPPALGGMLIEPTRPSADKRRSDDILCAPASIVRRGLAALVDGGIVGVSVATFAALFLRVNQMASLGLVFVGTLGAVAVLLWMAYEFLFVVYTGSTPGLRAAKLQLTRFDGKPVSRRTRRWRVLASFLSAFSVGLGYVWCFLDESGMCWHDRITHTYLRVSAGK